MMNGSKKMMNGSPIPLLPPRESTTVLCLNHYLELLKIHLCLYIGLSAVFGHVMARQGFSPESLLFGMFVFILACGSAVLNNIQDRTYDVLFTRTVNRSLPRKKVSVVAAKKIAALAIGCGLLSIFLVSGTVSFFLGGAAVICYNGIYTPLKKRSLLAILPGSLCGMIPPLMGWAAAGGAISDPCILMIMSVFGLWQMAHFFILLLKTGQTYLEAADKNQFPLFTAVYSKNEIKVQTLIWTSLYSLSWLLLLMNGTLQNEQLSFLAGLISVGITLLISVILLMHKYQNISLAWAAINLSILFFMGTGIFDACFFQQLPGLVK